MIKKILSGKTCADCRMCCIFDRYDIWEMPLFEEKTMLAVKNAVPDAAFAKKGNGYFINTAALSENELFTCPALTGNGCLLGDEKPFDCRIWPFRIMRQDDSLVIAVSSLCEAVHGQPHDELRAFLREGLGEKIFEYAKKFPEAVHELYDNYTVLLREDDIRRSE